MGWTWLWIFLSPSLLECFNIKCNLEKRKSEVYRINPIFYFFSSSSLLPNVPRVVLLLFYFPFQELFAFF